MHVKSEKQPRKNNLLPIGKKGNKKIKLDFGERGGGRPESSRTNGWLVIRGKQVGNKRTHLEIGSKIKFSSWQNRSGEKKKKRKDREESVIKSLKRREDRARRDSA